MGKVLEQYQQKVATGTLNADNAQLDVLADLDALKASIEASKASWQPFGRLYKWVFEGDKPNQGLYFYGTVGRGKSMLMDMFYDAVDIPHKRRVHFHSFMDEVHERMHNVKSEPGVDPVHKIAVDIAKDAQLLCFDEFYISNIADAMMLGRLLEMLLKTGVVICTTSNWAPEDLFQGGHNRVLFKPFIKMIGKTFHILPLGEGQDWRRKDGDHLPYFIQSGDVSALKSIFNDLSNHSALDDANIQILDDVVYIEAHSQNALHVKFKEVCGRAFAAEHYMEIADKYDVVVLEDVPVFNKEQQDEAMRFVVLVDIFYEHGTKLVCSAADLPHLLCPEGESAFAFERTASRLIEMQKRI